MQNFGEKGSWVYPGTAQIFLSTPIISGTGKATNFKFGRYIQRVHPNKKLLKNLGEKGAWANRQFGLAAGLRHEQIPPVSCTSLQSALGKLLLISLHAEGRRSSCPARPENRVSYSCP